MLGMADGCRAKFGKGNDALCKGGGPNAQLNI